MKLQESQNVSRVEDGTGSLAVWETRLTSVLTAMVKSRAHTFTACSRSLVSCSTVDLITMKGITKQDKVEFIEKVAKALSKTDARSKFLRLEDYNSVKKFVRNIDRKCARLVDNGQHFLDIMTRALRIASDTALNAKLAALREENKAKPATRWEPGNIVTND